MARTLDMIAAHLFEGVMAPLVLGGSMRPGPAIGARAARALAEGPRASFADPALLARVRDARVRRARLLVPIDDLGPPTGAEWALAAALHDVIQSASPRLNAPMRRDGARRLIGLARDTIERAGAPRSVYDAVSRHAWLARMLEIARTDTTVSWWSETRVFLGVDPPARVQRWPGLRRVRVLRTERRLSDLAPLAIDRALFVAALSELLAQTPLTDLATCTRATPPFAWSEAALGLIASRVGRTLAMRALARLPAEEVDTTLGRATHALAQTPGNARAAQELLGERSAARAPGHGVSSVG